MLNKLIDAIKAMWAGKREAVIVAIGYILWMLIFYVIGITQAQLDALIAIVLITGVYAVFAWGYFKYFDN